MPDLNAKTADKHLLYQQSVQSPDAECAFMDRVYKNRYGELPARFREDFCGTALNSCEWVRRRRTNHAWGVDLCSETQDWGRRHNLSRLSADAAARVHLINGNVLDVNRPKVQVIGAFNFSYFIFKTHRELTAYFAQARRGLEKNGLFILDAYGGYESQQVMKEETRHNGFIYVWDQAAYNPVNDHTTCHIHFKFRDGSRLQRAFTYDWRLWTLGGITDALAAAGFSKSEVYWEGTAADGEGNGVYRRALEGENCPGWNAYVVGIP